MVLSLSECGWASRELYHRILFCRFWKRLCELGVGGARILRFCASEEEKSIAMGVIGDVLSLIPQYTGLSTGTFFTVVALLVGIYYLISGLLAPPAFQYAPVEPPKAPLQLGEVTLEELLAYDGTDPKKELLMAIKGQIYDVSQSRAFYGPGGPYALFAGRDASRALAKMSFEQKDLTGDIEGLSAYEIDALNDWEMKFMSKYFQSGPHQRYRPHQQCE